MQNILRITALLLILAVASACSRSEEEPVGSLSPLLPLHLVENAPPLALPTDQDYLTDIDFSPKEAKYFDLINGAMSLSEPELEMLARNGFAVSERQSWKRFVEAYAWIYWKDLPVLITTDSMLHMVHQSYSDLLKALERDILIPEMQHFLLALQKQIEIDQQANSNAALNQHYEDVKIYIDVAYGLLQGEYVLGQQGREYNNLALAADSYAEVKLFGTGRLIDFTLFQPRGHYLGNGPDLEQYFRAMSWLAHIDFRWTKADPSTSKVSLDPDAIAATLILHQTIENAGVYPTWERVNGLLEALVGGSDNMILPDLERFINDTGLTPETALNVDEAELLDQLNNNNYGQQRITGQLLYRHVANDSADPMPRPTSFMLMGQRFAIDPYVMSNLVYDRLIVDEQPVMRPLPSPLDVMYTLGNDRAITHLTDELAQYRYDGQLSALRTQVDQLPNTFWDAPIYNQWLQLIRTLNPPTTAENYPLPMRTAAWADKTLHTQLASWTQLRHDHILYIKQSFTMIGIACEYPAGYVEPYPAFYAALYDFARSGYEALARLDGFGSTTRLRAMDYFENVMSIAQRLQTLAEKELRLEEFTPDEEVFIKSLVVDQGSSFVCGAGFDDRWTGWYTNMFFEKDDNPALIADIHTNPTNDSSHPLYPPRVLHVATGPVVPVYMIVDTDEGSTLYVGPSFTYFEVTEQGDSSTPPTRLTDQQWRARLSQPDYPDTNVPEWTQSFRITTPLSPSLLNVPN